MSRAFVKEERPEPPVQAPPRAPLPDGVLNYVTPRGLSRLRKEADELDEERRKLELTPAGDERTRALSLLRQRKALLDERLASAELVPPREDVSEVRFGACVTVRDEAGHERRYRIVGVDEADASQGHVAFVSPLARALLGKARGETVSFRTPRGEEELEVVDISYDFTAEHPGSSVP